MACRGNHSLFLEKSYHSLTFFEICQVLRSNPELGLESIQPAIAEKIITIDGKSSRHRFDDEVGVLPMITAFSTEERLVLDQEKVSHKSNEITAIVFFYTVNRHSPISFCRFAWER